jgi:vacuolar-type H+-ATPase subunit F/Vma7
VARLAVVTSAALADGFRLGGCLTIVAAPGAGASATLRETAATGDVGVLLVTTDLWTSVDERLRGQLERLARPIVLPIPAGTVGDGRARGQLLGEMLQRAIGYRIELAIGGSPGGGR